MSCAICDARLDSEEIKFERDFGRYAPCRRCINESGVSLELMTGIEELESLYATLFGEEGDNTYATNPLDEGETPLS